MRKPLGITTQGNSFFYGYHNLELIICSCGVVDLKRKNLGSNTNKLKYKTLEKSFTNLGETITEIMIGHIVSIVLHN